MIGLDSFTVTFRKQVSDGNYGTEAAEVTLGLSAEGGELVQLDDGSYPAIGHWLHRAREAVHAELSRSPAGKVRAAVAPLDERP